MRDRLRLPDHRDHESGTHGLITASGRAPFDAVSAQFILRAPP